MIKGVCSSTLKLLLLLTPIQALTCSQRVTDDGNVGHTPQASFQSVDCSRSGNNRTLNITIFYDETVPSQLQIEYQCYQSEQLSSEANIILKSWDSNIPIQLAVDVEISNSTKCLAEGCYIANERNTPTVWMSNMSCSFKDDVSSSTIAITSNSNHMTDFFVESTDDVSPPATTAITLYSNHTTDIFETTSSVHWSSSSPAESSPPIATAMVLPNSIIIVVVMISILFISVIVVSLVIVLLITRRRTSSKISITGELNYADVVVPSGSYCQDPETQSVRTLYCSLSSTDDHNTEKRDCTAVHQKLQISININSTSNILQDEADDLTTAESCLPDSPQLTNSSTHLQFTNTDISDNGYGGSIDKSGSSMNTTVNTPDYIQMSLLVQN